MLRRPRDIIDDGDLDDLMNMDAEMLATPTNTRADPPMPNNQQDPMEVEDDDEIVMPEAPPPEETYLSQHTRRRQTKAWRRMTHNAETLTMARLIKSKLSDWLDNYAEDTEECWRIIEYELKRQVSAPIPTERGQNFAHIHELIRLVELASNHAEEMPPGVIKQIHRLGSTVWTYYTYTLHCRGAPKVDMADWWRLMCLVRYTITTNMPMHALFSGAWYQQTTIRDLLMMNKEASAYLMWAHAHGWSACEPPSPPAQQPANSDDWDYLAAASEMSAEMLSPQNRVPSPRMEPKSVENWVAPEWRQGPVASLTIERTWRIISLIHANFNRLRWTPATELFVLLLWHHVQGFTLGRLPRELYTQVGKYLWETNGEEGEVFHVANELFADRTSHILIRHVACIHAFYSLRSQVSGTWEDATQFINAIPLGVYDQMALAAPEFLPTHSELALMEDSIDRAHFLNSCQILPGETTIDKHAVKNQYLKKLPLTILVPGDTLMLAKTTISLKLHPRTVLAKFRPGQDGILADLSIPYTAASMIFKANKPGGTWPKGQEDLELLGSQAHTALFFAVLRALEAGRPDRRTTTAAQRTREREKLVQGMLSDPQLSLKQALEKNEHRLYRQAAVVAETKKDIASLVECRPLMERWWILCEDSQFDMPFLYPNMLRNINKKEGRQLPTLFSVRGEHWIFDTEHWRFFGHTTHITDALRTYACLSAFLYPDHYETHIDPMLVYWFKDSLKIYARAGRASVKQK